MCIGRNGMILYKKDEMDTTTLFNLCWDHSDNLLLLLADDFLVKRINPAAENLLGWKPTEVLNKDISVIFQEQSMQPFILKNTSINENSTVLFHNNQKLKINWTIIPTHNTNDKTNLIFIIGKKEIQPIDEQFEILQLENVVKFAPGFLYWKNNDSVYLGCNDEFARLAGLNSRDDVKGKTDFDLIWKERAELYVKIDKAVIESGVAQLDYEEVITLSNNKTITAITNKVPMRNSKGEVIGILGITTDITHQKEVELALSAAKETAEVANQAKSDFIANISHDIRTPLSGIVGMSKLLEEAALSDKERQYARWVNDSGNQLLELLNGVLDVVSADHVKESELHEETFDLYNTIQSIGKLELPALEAKHIKFKVDIEEGVPRYIISDKIKIHRILLNLLGNAIKFTQAGYVKIGVRQLARHKNNVKLEISVEDTGIGIPEEALPHLFDRFFKVNPAYKGIYRGHGLGLHIAQKYVSFLNGDIHVESEVGKGTRFYFTLTLKPGVKPEQKHDDVIESTLPPTLLSPAHEERSPLGNNIVNENTSLPHLLLVEDNNIALRLLETLTNQHGCRFTSATNGEDALELAKHTDFDLIITDVGLPGISGIELTQAIREWEKRVGKKSRSIVGLTAHALQEADTPCLRAGMNKVFQKPIRPEQIELLIKQFIQSSPAAVEPEPAKVTSGLGLDLPDTEEQLFQLEAFPVLDIDSGIQSLGSKEFLIEILGQLIQDEFPKEIIALEAAFRDKNWSLMEKIAHKLKGGALYCGTVKLKQACQYLERYQKAGHSSQLNELALQLFSVIEETRQAVTAWLNQ